MFPCRFDSVRDAGRKGNPTSDYGTQPGQSQSPGCNARFRRMCYSEASCGQEMTESSGRDSRQSNPVRATASSAKQTPRHSPWAAARQRRRLCRKGGLRECAARPFARRSRLPSNGSRSDWVRRCLCTCRNSIQSIVPGRSRPNNVNAPAGRNPPID
ncbi:hypothetical protein BD413DRAFT_292210 [Trametes elegans]|nr:hypothetical protein BD413DRAFT_292210 [Trametes elegans]